MYTHRRCAAVVVWILALVPGTRAASSVHPRFDLATPESSPFPSDRFTVPDAANLTGLRVELPMPDCVERRSDCEDVVVINTLDGFNIQPRLSIPFDGVIDVHTVTSETVFLLELPCANDDETCDNGRALHKIGINQVVWNTFTNTLHLESDELLDQHRRYALIVTRGVRDTLGASISPSLSFQRFRQTVRSRYKHALLDAVHAARKVGVEEARISVASVFTTQSVTAPLERIRDQIKAGPAAVTDFNLGPGGLRTVFPLRR